MRGWAGWASGEFGEAKAEVDEASVSVSSVAFKLLRVAKSLQNTHDPGLLTAAHRA